jgi:hypothetical protein
VDALQSRPIVINIKPLLLIIHHKTDVGHRRFDGQRLDRSRSDVNI